MIRNTLSRRTFIGGAAAGAGLLVLPIRVFGANARLNVGCIGAGGKGGSDVSGVAGAGANIVALCDVDKKRAEKSFRKYPDAKRYTDFRVMLEKQKDIDAVTVSTPDHIHAVASIMAMKLGKHVYCQKPLSHSVYEARRMTEVAAEMKVATQMGNQAHAGEPIRRAVELVRAGIIGKVKEVHAMTNRPIWPQGMKEPLPAQDPPDSLDWDLWLGPAPKRAYNKGYCPFNWRGWWDFGTGALGDMACHIMDMAYWALNLGSPDSFEAESFGNTDQSPPLWSTVTYHFPARGEQPPVKYVWYDGNPEPKKKDSRNVPSADILEGQNPKQWDLILIGEKGKMFFNRSKTNWIITPKSILEGFKEPPKTIRRVKNEDQEWVDACKGGPPALSNFAQSGPFSEVVVLGNLAIRTGEKVEWDGRNLKAKNSQKANRYVRREYRAGWKL